MGLRIFSAIRCMLDCAYWYNLEKDDSFTFPFTNSYGTLSDNEILSDWDNVCGFIHTQPVVLVVKSPELFKEIHGKDTIEVSSLPANKYVSTERSIGQDKYLYITTSKEVDKTEFFVVIPTDSTREDWQSRKGYSKDSYHFRKIGLFDGFFSDMKIELENGYNCISPIKFYGISGFMYSEIGSSNFDDVDDNVVGDGVYANIMNILRNKGKLADRYNTLVSALNGIDKNLSSKLNDALNPKSEVLNKINPLEEALRKMSGE